MKYKDLGSFDYGRTWAVYDVEAWTDMSRNLVATPRRDRQLMTKRASGLATFGTRLLRRYDGLNLTLQTREKKR
ncbi:porin [Escherichia coli]|uniref:porin n=1 Tax=Escherichia coli TaxID=562 RepID=UPI003D7884E1